MSAVEDEKPPEDYLEDYLSKLELWGRDPSTVQNYKQSFNYFRDFLEENNKGPEELTKPEANEFISYLLEDANLLTSTATVYIRNITNFYSYYSDKGFDVEEPTIDVNPFQEPIRNRGEQLNSQRKTHKREISVNEMSEFIRNKKHPFDRALLMIFTKTGKRAGEVANLDSRDVNLDHSGFQKEFPECRPQIENRPDTIYFAPSSDISEGNVVNGEKRMMGNKSKNATIYPIDSELKQALLKWFAIRLPSSSPARPVFVSPVTGERLAQNRLYKPIRKLTEPYGWYQKGADYGQNVSPHYFRTWWGSHFEPRVEDRGVIKYLRGDAGDIVDDYRQNWGTMTRDKYLNNIYKFYD